MRPEAALPTEEVYDRQTEEIMHRALRRHGTFVDVGAHTGKFVDVALATAPVARHFAFEPLPEFAEALRARYADRPNVEIHAVALSDTAGEASFVHNLDVPSHSGLRERDYPFPGTQRRTIVVPTRRLDDVVGDVPVRVLKVDVEGGELLVLRGASRLLATQKPVVVFEFGLGAAEHYGHGPADVVALFAEYGMAVYTLDALLAGGRPLDAAALEREYRAGRYYFAAHDPEAKLDFPRRLNLGCGYDHRPGYLNVDLFERHAPDLVADVRDLSMLPSDYFDEIVAHDVLEHLPRGDTRRALGEWARVLRRGGTVSLRVPSFLHLCERLLDRYGERTRHEDVIHLAYGTQAAEGDFHLTSFTPLLLHEYLSEVGLLPQRAAVIDGWMLEVVAEKGAATWIDLHGTLGSRRSFVGRLVRQLLRDRWRAHFPGRLGGD